MATFFFALQGNGPLPKHFNSHSINLVKTPSLSNIKLRLSKEFQVKSISHISKFIKDASSRFFDAFVDSVFQFVEQPLLPSQRNFAPVKEVGEAVKVACTEGKIPEDFPEGIYVRNGPNPLFGGLKATTSIFGRSSHIWVEGEGVLHAVYFIEEDHGQWMVMYDNRYVQSKTFKIESQRDKPSFLPAVEGDNLAIVAAHLLNVISNLFFFCIANIDIWIFPLRFGMVNKHMSNTNIIEHGGKFYCVAENYVPQEVNLITLETFEDWDINGAWERPFTSHPKIVQKAPGTGELVIMGVDALKPYYVLGIISADGQKLLHKVDIKLTRGTLSHEIGVTQKYNIIMDYPLTIDINRLMKGGRLMEYEKGDYARIGVMPRYGDADSVKWFDVESHCTFHIINTFEDGNEVVVRGCRSLGSVLPGPDRGVDKFEWFSRGFKPIREDKENFNGRSTEDGFLFSRVYEWRLNMVTGDVKEKNLTGTDCSMDFPMINGGYTGLKHKYGYTQVIDSIASSNCGMALYGALAKLYFEESNGISEGESKHEQEIKVEYHRFEKNSFCTGSAFVSKSGSTREDDGYIVSFVHNEDTDISQVYVIDTKKFEDPPVAKITLPQRVPFGFHGIFAPMHCQF
ncbi:Carotenoid oxygenase [Dillenia turbinata]|uniref:Carotenoid oxygenase n=1 Tax=Dillenia turbinata TaxID=194707 RepID=A0AAN8ZBB9_9MAGN